MTIVAIPVKPFGAAKRRLSGMVSDGRRRSLGVELARHTATAALAAGARPVILSADDGVTEWAEEAGFDVLLDEGSSLDEAAHSATLLADGEAWIVCHADLPLLRPSDLLVAMAALEDTGWVLAASSDGGTSLIGGRGPFHFSYGPASFHRHLRSLADREIGIVSRLGTLLDLDTPSDLEAAVRHPLGRWLAPIVE